MSWNARIVEAVVALACAALVGLSAPALGQSCLDHSHSAEGTGSPEQARARAKSNWAHSVKLDDGDQWASIRHARNAKMTCRIVDPAKGRTVCTFKATPCADR